MIVKEMLSVMDAEQPVVIDFRLDRSCIPTWRGVACETPYLFADKEIKLIFIVKDEIYIEI